MPHHTEPGEWQSVQLPTHALILQLKQYLEVVEPIQARQPPCFPRPQHHDALDEVTARVHALWSSLERLAWCPVEDYPLKHL